MSIRVLIVGGSAAGVGVATRLRRMCEDVEIILFEKDQIVSQARCGTPYYLSGKIKNPDALVLETPESLKAWFNVDARTNHQVLAIDTKAQTITVQTPNSAGGTAEIAQEAYDILVLATGSEPLIPNIPGTELSGVFWINSLFDTLNLKAYIEQNNPQTATVIGSNQVALEITESLQELGIAVTIAEPPSQFLAGLDYDMACEVYHYLGTQGIKVLRQTPIKAISKYDNYLHLYTPNDKFNTDLVLICQGAMPATALAQLAGLAIGQSGGIVVNQQMQTSVDNIYAVGDAIQVVEKVSGQKTNTSQAGSASRQARVAADSIGKGKGTVPALSVPGFSQGVGTAPLPSSAATVNKMLSIVSNAVEDVVETQSFKDSNLPVLLETSVFRVIDLEVASTGINETQAKQLGLNYQKSFTSSTSHVGYYPAAVNMTVKLLFVSDSGQVLGAQITGYDGVDKRIDVIATAIHFGATVDDLAKLDLGYSPPFSAPKDPVNIAGSVAQNVFTKKVKLYHWHDVDALPMGGSATLLDVRTQLEYADGAIDGYINIPLDQLRAKLAQLDRSKPVYVACKTGHRAFVACMILAQKGFDCYNLSGGYQFYKTVTSQVKVADKPLAAITKNVATDLSAVTSEVKVADKLPEPALASVSTATTIAPKSIAAPIIEPAPTTDTEAENSASLDSGTVESVSAVEVKESGRVYKVDAEGLQCPGPILLLSDTLQSLEPGDIVQITATDPAFSEDARSFCERTGNVFVDVTSKAGIFIAQITKGLPAADNAASRPGGHGGNGKNFIVFSGDLDKVIAAFIMANASAAMGRQVSMFFTFWGLNVLRKPKKLAVSKKPIAKMFGLMMPRGSKKLGLSRMNMGGLGAKMIRKVMKDKNIFSLEQLMQTAQKNGVQLLACSMSMGVMGIEPEELIDGVKPAGATTMLSFAEQSDMSLFI